MPSFKEAVEMMAEALKIAVDEIRFDDGARFLISVEDIPKALRITLVDPDEFDFSLSVGQGGVAGLEDDLQGDGLEAVVHALAAIDVEDADLGRPGGEIEREIGVGLRQRPGRRARGDVSPCRGGRCRCRSAGSPNGKPPCN